jgi:hypothetical protein
MASHLRTYYFSLLISFIENSWRRLIQYACNWFGSSFQYCTMLGYLVPLRHVFIATYHFWTPICNVLGYRRHRSVCYTSLFTTSLVSTTVSFYNVLGPSDVVSRSGPGSSALVLGSSLIYVSDRSLDLSSLCVSSVSLFYLSCPFICCPSKRVFAPRKEDTFHHGCIFRCSGFQQFDCLGILNS